MINNIRDKIRNIFGKTQEEEKEREKRLLELSLINQSGINSNLNKYNPFTNSKGELTNTSLNYQSLLDNPNLSQKVKGYITQATGLSPTQQSTAVNSNLLSTDSFLSSNPIIGSSYTGESINAGQSVSATGNSLVDSAQKYLGTPYVYGGDSSSDGGMDCSGFVYNALKDAGYNVDRTSANEYYKKGTSVSKNNLQPGDLIFYGDGKASHVGIYVGDGKMIHSAGGASNTKSNPGRGVEVKSIDYRKDYLGAKRLNK